MAPALSEKVSPLYSEKEHFSHPRSLQQEADYLRRNWRREGLPPNWDEFPGTGFQNKLQVDLIFSELQEGDPPEIRKEKLLRALRRTETDIKGFNLEYLVEGLVFPIHYKIKWLNGRKRLVDPFYDKLVVDTVSEEERKGSVKRALAEKIEPFLLDAPDGSIAVMTSPSGWTGMRGNDRKFIEYPDSQTYIWQKKGEEVLGFTIRTDFKNVEHRELLGRLSFEKVALDEDSSVCDYVESIVGIIPMGRQIDIKEVVDVMRNVRDDLSCGSTLAYKDRDWDEVYRDLDRRGELWRFDDQTKAWVEEFENYVLTSNLSRKEIGEMLATTILRISKFLRSGQLLKTTKETYSYMADQHRISYGLVLAHVQELPGCAGGGGSKSSLVNSITPRNGIESNSSHCDQCSNPEPHFHCPKDKGGCGGTIESGKGNTSCPHCGLTKEKAGSQCG